MKKLEYRHSYLVPFLESQPVRAGFGNVDETVVANFSEIDRVLVVLCDQTIV